MAFSEGVSFSCFFLLAVNYYPIIIFWFAEKPRLVCENLVIVIVKRDNSQMGPPGVLTSSAEYKSFRASVSF